MSFIIWKVEECEARIVRTAIKEFDVYKDAYDYMQGLKVKIKHEKHKYTIEQS